MRRRVNAPRGDDADVDASIQRLLSGAASDDESKRPRVRRAADKCLRYALTAAVVAIGLLVAFAICFGAFVAFDGIGVRVTIFIVRLMMPRPQHDGAVPATRSSSTEAFSTFDQMLDAAYHRFDHDLLLTGRRFDVDYFAYRPSTTKYGPHQWLWDSNFHQIINSHRDLHHSIADLYSQLASQDDATGFIPEMVYWGDDPNQHGIPRAMYGYSDSRRTDLTQMPVIGLAAESIDMRFADVANNVRPDRDKYRATLRARVAFLCNTVPRIHRYLDWWLQYRDPDGDGLVSILHPWESGLDASPLYDDVHRTNRARRVNKDPKVWTSWGPEGESTRPTPEELYPEFIILLYRYRHRARWDNNRILDPIAAQTPCGKDDKNANEVAAWKVTDSLLHRQRHAAEKAAEKEGNGGLFSGKRRAPLLSTSMVDGIFDVEDVGVNSVLAASLGAVARLYDNLLDTLNELEVTRREGHLAQGAKDDLPFWWDDDDATFDGYKDQAHDLNKGVAGVRGKWCCWPEPAHVHYTRSDKLAMLEKRALRARKQAQRLGQRLVDKAWVPVEARFVSFFHEYSTSADAAQVCMTEHTLHRDTVQSLMTLLIPGLPEEMVLGVLAAVEDTKRFGATSPTQTIPTVSRREADVFDPDDSTLMWRGPAWPTTNWLVAKGLATVALNTQYAPKTQAYAARLHAQLLDRWIAMHRKYGFHEYHHSDTGAGLGQRGLGMSFLLIDAALAASTADNTRVALLTDAAKAWITAGPKRRAVEDTLVEKTSGPWRDVLDPPHAPHVSQASLQQLLSRPQQRAGFAMAPVSRAILVPQYPYDDGTLHHVPPKVLPTPQAGADDPAEVDDDAQVEEGEEPQLFSEMDFLASDDEWRELPRLTFGCCAV